ncbi:hypothetical protein M231_07124 [Tremella mesenterica]|uniref:NAD(P)-binding protein n=1 Tax=Tremella mesenterica TaxID=5217 RepID=A0A4Q1BCX3_TREME|nr:hypothetical protein M231_07124 [Tremella mesenterica]
MVRPAGLFSNRYKLEDIPDLSGKVAVVTGGSRGIGEQVVSALAQKGCEVHILSSTEAHAREAIDKITKSTSVSASLLHHHTIDLGSLADVISLSKTLSSSLSRLDILYLIAGVGVAPYGETNDGIGNHYGVNVLAHMVLVDGLLPKMRETAQTKTGDEKWTTRIVAESSELHRAAPSEIKCEDLEEMNSEDMDPTKLYGRSKLFDLMFIRQLAYHLPPLASPTPILALSVHPGAVQTEQQQGATEAYGLPGKALEVVASWAFMTPDQGAESALWAGTSPAVGERREEAQGRYFTEADGKVDTESAQGQDQELGRKLWDLSVRVLKEKVGYEVKM